MHIIKVIDIYKKIYKLKILSYEEDISDNDLTLYKNNHYFVTITIYNTKKEIFLIRDFNKNIGWELPGGCIKKNENIISGVNRIVLKETGLSINELEPISIIHNNFLYKNKKIKNIGVAFIANADGRIKDYSKNIKGGFFFNYPSKLAYQNNKIFKLSKRVLKSKKHNPPENEIESFKSIYFLFTHAIHNLIIKPIGKISSRKIEDKIISLIKNHPQSILDVSCGDSEIINKLSIKFHPKVCIGNDISWKVISLLGNKNENVIFTNHNALELPFNTKFDLVIFKNTLHHIEKKYQKKIIENLKKISKQLIIVDIDNPLHSSILAKLWNKYYVYFLNDQGENFVDFNDFKKLINLKSNGKSKIGKIKTIKGDYFFYSKEN